LYGRLATGPAAALRRTKYVDIGSFFHLLFGNGSALAPVLSAVAALAGLIILAIAWWRSPSWNAASRDLLWAATFSGALVCNLYTPIYDTILVAPAVALAAGVMLSGGGRQREVFGGWLVLLYIVPWVTQSFAEFLRFQPFTVVLAGFAWWTLSWARRSAGNPDEPAKHLPEHLPKHLQGADLESRAGLMICQTQGTMRYQLLGATTYAVSVLTRNFGRRLSVFLRSYSPSPAILWERDR
jgi:hypothetical protein